MAMLQITGKKLSTSPDKLLPSLIDKSLSQVRKMTTMITGFLNLSRLESGQMDIIKSRFNLKDLLETVVAETEMIVSSHKIRVRSGESLEIFADRDKIETVVSNLLSNAAKYSRIDTEITLICTAGSDHVQVSVKDEGIGIKDEDKLHLFERYYRVESNAPYISGFGIGLYLSAEIIQRHNGKIWVESELGKGSTFYFTLPIDKYKSFPQ